MAGIAAGDEQALADLYDRHGRFLYSLALRVLRDPALAEDVVHDVFLTIWTKPWLYEASRGVLAAWLAGIVRNRAIDRLRREKRSVTTDPVEFDFRSDDGQSPEADAIENERADGVRSALGSVPPRQREVLELMYFCGLSQSEAGERLGVPLGTIKSRAFHGLQRLRDLLGENGVVDR